MMTAPWSQLDGAALGHAEGEADRSSVASPSNQGAPITMPTEEEGGES